MNLSDFEEGNFSLHHPFPGVSHPVSFLCNTSSAGPVCPNASPFLKIVFFFRIAHSSLPFFPQYDPGSE